MTELHVSSSDSSILTPIDKLQRDVREAADSLNHGQVRYVVDLYYQIQEMRKGLRNQERALDDAGEPTLIVSHFADQVERLEKQIPPIMDRWTDSTLVGRWSKAQKGIGPVLAAGLLAHIDIEKAPHAGSIWKYAGLDPSQEWNKGEKRPWNHDLKVLAWKIGDSFVKQSGRENAYYGHLYRQRKEKEVVKNDNLAFADQAQEALETRNIKDTRLKATYEAGRLPDGRLELRARRHAVKLFLSHWHEVAFIERYGTRPEFPYAFDHLGHSQIHYREPPHFEEARAYLDDAISREA